MIDIHYNGFRFWRVIQTIYLEYSIIIRTLIVRGMKSPTTIDWLKIVKAILYAEMLEVP